MFKCSSAVWKKKLLTLSKVKNVQMFGKKTFWLFPRLKTKLQLKVEPNKNVQMTEGRVFGVYFFVRIQQHLSLLARAHLRTWRNSILLSYNFKVYNVPLAKCDNVCQCSQCLSIINVHNVCQCSQCFHFNPTFPVWQCRMQHRRPRRQQGSSWWGGISREWLGLWRSFKINISVLLQKKALDTGGLGGLGDTCGADPVGLSSHILWAQSAVAGSLERQRKYWHLW